MVITPGSLGDQFNQAQSLAPLVRLHPFHHQQDARDPASLTIGAHEAGKRSRPRPARVPGIRAGAKPSALDPPQRHSRHPMWVRTRGPNSTSRRIPVCACPVRVPLCPATSRSPSARDARRRPGCHLRPQRSSEKITMDSSSLIGSCSSALARCTRTRASPASAAVSTISKLCSVSVAN